MKATVVGNNRSEFLYTFRGLIPNLWPLHHRDEPLRNYNGEDVLIRLPKGYRTFDVDFISIYNTDEQKSFGHVLIPSLLVPPCSDD